MTLNAYDADIGELHIASGGVTGVTGAPDAQVAGLDEAALAIATPRKEIVFIEDNVADIGSLVSGIGRDKQVVMLDSSKDGLHQIAQALAGQRGVDAVHIISHGQAGAVDLGSLLLNTSSLGTHADDLQAIRQGMSADGDILLYGCKVGADAGFVDQLAIATGADVAASSDLTGAAALGGNWNLEVASGNIETTPVIDAHTAALYQEVLSISPGTLGFSHTAYFAPGVVNPSDNHSASTDVVYRVNNNAAYALLIDGTRTAVTTYSSSPGQVFTGVYASETALTFSFVGGQLFTPTSIALSNWSVHTTYTTENLVIKGYDASGHQVGTSATYTLLPDYTYAAKTISLASLGSTPVKTLKVTASGGSIDYLMLDSISITSVAPPPPQVVAVTSSTANGSYKAGDVIHISVGFDQLVDVTGTPTLTLETGTTDRVVSYSSGSGTATLTFDYTVQAGDTSADLDYLSTAALALNGGTIKGSTSGSDASLTLPTPGNFDSLGANAAIVIDTTAPAAPSAPDLASASDTGTSTSDNLTKNTAPTFTGTAESGSTVKLYDGATLVGTATANSGNYSITSSALANGSHTITATATDAAGNVSAASAGLAVTVDTVAPTVTIASDVSALKAGETATITFTFSEDPGATFTWSGSAGDVTVSGGTLSALSGSGLTRTAIFTPTANTDNGSASVGVTAASYADAAGNFGGAGTAATFGYDTKAPTLAIASDKAALTAGETATITFTFSEDPGATFTSADIAVSGGLLSALAGTGTTRTATFTPDADIASGTASITVAEGAYADAAGNTGGAGTTPALTYHTLAPAAPAQVALDTISDTGTSNTDGLTQLTQLSFSGVATAGATIKLYDSDGTTQIGSGTADGAGHWDITTPPLSEGAHTVVAKAVDAWGNVSAPAAAAAVTVDTTAPTLTIATDKAALKAGETATITFTFSEDPGATFTAGDVNVSGGTLSALSGSGTVRTATFTPTADTDNGHASIAVGAAAYTDAAGNNGAARTGPAVAFDTKVPAAPATPDLASGSDSGTSSTDDVTSVATPTFTGAAGSVEGGATVKLYDGTNVIATTTAAGDGSWSAAASTLAEGAHTITATAVDAAGNESAASAGLTVTIDRTAPAAQVAALAFSDDTGGSASDFVTSNPHQTIAVTLDAAPQAGETVRVSLDNGATWAAAPVTGNTASLAATLAGSGTLQVQVTDAAGNAGPIHSQAYVLDTAAPSAPSTPDLAPGSDTGVSNSDDITSATLPTLSGTAESGATVTLYDGTTAIGSAVATGGTWQITATTPLGQGSHTISATATDAAGNVGATSSALAVQVITTAPTTGIASLALSADSGPSASDFVTKEAAQTLSGTLDAALATGQRVQVSLDHGSNWSDAAATTGGTAWSYGTTLAAGSHDIQVRVLDAVGNAGPMTTQAYTLDTTAPTLAIASDANPLKAHETATITFTFSEDPGATFTAADVAVSGGLLSALAGTGTTRTAVFTPDADMDNQTASITVAAGSYTDAAGNAGGAGTPVSIYFDTLVPGAPPAPVLDPLSDTGLSATDGITNQAAPTIAGTADPHAVIFVYDGDARIVGIIGADSTGAWHVKTDLLGDGMHILRAVQFDAIGNASPFGAPLLVSVDTQAPATLAAPLLAAASDSGTPGDRITKVATPTFSGKADPLAQVTLYDTDGHTALGAGRADADGNWTITTSLLADGVHDVSARQGDVAGNWSAAGPAFALTVDTAAPAAPSAPQLQAQSDTGVRGDGVTYAVPVLAGSAAAGDLVTLYDGAKAIGTAHAGTDGTWTIVAQGLLVGHHTLTATSTDAAGNVSAAGGAFALTIEDAPVPLVDGVPVVTLPVLLPGGGGGIEVQVPIVGADRADSTGAGATADIPLANNAGGDVLVAHVAPGYGLTATGAPVTTVADGSAALIAAIQAAATSNGSDAAPLASNGHGYLAQLAAGEPLLVQTVAPATGAGAPAGTLTLSGAAGAQPHVALVIDARAMSGGTIALQNVDFAAVVGAAHVVAQSDTKMLTGDAASQDFEVQAGSGTQLFAGGGDDTLRFGAAAASVQHTANGATAAATATTTTLLHGGAGDDTAVFAGARADFDIETHHGYLVVRSKAAPDAQALVVNVEHLQFADATVAVQNGADLTPLTGLYQAVLGRQADVYGLDFWAGMHDKGVSLGTIAVNMIGSAERLSAQGGFTGDTAHDVGLLYAGLFDRAADPAGLAFWTAAVQHGATLAQVADAMLQSVEMVGQQGTPLDWNFSV